MSASGHNQTSTRVRATSARSPALLYDKLGRDLGVALGASLGPAILDRDGATLDPAEFTQSPHKSSRPRTIFRSISAQEPDGRQLARLLRACSERPSDCRTAGKRDELAPSHSITSSARATTFVGISRPIAFAVFRLITNSNVTGWAKGRSSGLVPRRIL